MTPLNTPSPQLTATLQGGAVNDTIGQQVPKTSQSNAVTGFAAVFKQILLD